METATVLTFEQREKHGSNPQRSLAKQPRYNSRLGHQSGI
jgi:hypothetical protein